jgi:CheY-like chemotaxis protein
MEVPGNTVQRSPTVLIVEDSEGCATTLEVAFLGIPQISVVLAASAQDALRILEKDNGAVCALVTDLNMPRMDGFELIERVRGDGRHGKLPIIVVSGDIDPETPHRIARLGADAFFTKPYSPAQVRQKLEQLLNDYRRCA